MYNVEEMRSQSKMTDILSDKHCDNFRSGIDFLETTEVTWVMSQLPTFLCLVIHVEPIFHFLELKSYVWRGGTLVPL